MRPLTDLEVRARISNLIEHSYGGKQRTAAIAWGVSPQYLSSVLIGKRPPSEKILAESGLIRTVMVAYFDQSKPPSRAPVN